MKCQANCILLYIQRQQYYKFSSKIFQRSTVLHMSLYFISPFAAVTSLVVSYYKGKLSKSRRCKYNDACALRAPDELVQSI